MKKEFVTYQQSLKLKALGFDEPCFGYFSNDRRDCKLEFIPVKLAKNWNGIESNLDESPIYNDRNKKEVKESLDERNLLFLWTSAPTRQSAFRWFREKYSFYVIINPSINNDFTCVIWTSKGQYYIGVFLSYEEAELACLDKLIEIIETNQNK